MMKAIALALALVVGCDEHGSKPPGDSVPTGNEVVVILDAPTGTVDAPKAVEQACAAACDKITMCANEPPSPECNMGCAEDLGDCTPQQVMDVQNCAALGCGTGTPDMSPVVMCLEAIPCINP